MAWSKETKQKAVEMMTSGKSHKEITEATGVPSATLSTWKPKSKKEALDGIPSTEDIKPKDKSYLEQLEEKNKILIASNKALTSKLNKATYELTKTQNELKEITNELSTAKTILNQVNIEFPQRILRLTEKNKDLHKNVDTLRAVIDTLIDSQLVNTGDSNDE